MKKIIILSVATATMIVFTGCNGNNEDKTAQTNKTEVTAKAPEAKKVETPTKVEEAKQSIAKATEATKEAVTKTAEALKEKATKAAEETKKVAAKVEEKTKEAVAKTTEAAAKVVEKAKEVVAGNEKGQTIFASKCASCHGTDGKTKALGKSEVIAGWDSAKVEEALQGYKAGTRNVHGMGALMKGQVASLSDEDIKAIAQYISSLK